jgi:D-sorbitol dehydrogenase (acceptor)
LKNRHVLLTGAGGGIGLAVTEACIAEGANCSVVDRAATARRGEWTRCSGAIPAAWPTSRPTSRRRTAIARLLAEAQRRFWPAAYPVQQRGGVRPRASARQRRGLFRQRIFDVNVKGMFFVMQAVLRQMVEAGTQGASVINIASQAGRRGEALVSHYCATKAAVISYTQSAALAMAPHGIRVNGISPGVVDTPMWDHVDALFARAEGLQPGEKKRAWASKCRLAAWVYLPTSPARRYSLPATRLRYITAQTLNVDGGNVMS